MVFIIGKVKNNKKAREPKIQNNQHSGALGDEKVRRKEARARILGKRDRQNFQKS